MVSIVAAATGLLLTGMLAFALAAGTATPRVDSIASVVTDRPVREPAVAAPTAVKVPTVVAAPKPVETPAVAPGFTSRLITTARRRMRAGVSPKPVDVPKAIVVTPRPEADTDSDDDSDDHEVVTPGVRDDTDDNDDAHKDIRRSDSYDRSDDSSKPAFHKGD